MHHPAPGCFQAQNRQFLTPLFAIFAHRGMQVSYRRLDGTRLQIGGVGRMQKIGLQSALAVDQAGRTTPDWAALIGMG
jgi:hypothetical protein